MTEKAPSSNDKVRQCAIALHDMCRDRLEEGMEAEDVAIAALAAARGRAGVAVA